MHPVLPPSVRTKTSFYEAWFGGAFGNKAQTWQTLEELEASSYNGKVTVRYREPGSPFLRYGVPKEEVRQLVRRLCESAGAEERIFTFNEAMPDDKLLIQGEIMRCVQHYTFFYSTEPQRMSTALRSSGKQVHGLQALSLVKYFVDPSSYEDIQAILDKYDSAVVEFSAYATKVGSLPRRNTVIWEVREY